MATLVPPYSKSQIDKAGKDLISGNSATVTTALPVVEMWRRAHNYPLATFLTVLRHRAKAIDQHAIVAQRIKRMTSIETKLKRYSSTRLTQMQDIGGCRAVMSSMQEVNALLAMYETDDAGLPLDQRGKIINYIERPKTSGYRGVHLIFRYSGKKSEFHGMNIEIQLRSAKQHAWATAVETVGTFIHSALKSSRGDRDWLRFFAIMGSIIANMEECPRVPQTPSVTEERAVLLEYIYSLNALNVLRSLGNAIDVVRHYQLTNDRYFLLELSPGTKQLEVRGYRKDQLKKASENYDALESEAKGTGRMVVLVSVGAIAELRRAYPNYFLDTSAFVDLVEQVVDNNI